MRQTATASQAAAPVTRKNGEGEFPYSKEDFNRIAALLRDKTGIDLAESKSPLVYSRLTKRLRKLNIGSFVDYYKYVSSEAGAQERTEMFAALTTNVTRFFREPHHFEHLRKVALPPLLQAAKSGARIRIWSAACSSGEEPYSIAMEVLSQMPDAANYDVKILATDINSDMTARGRKGEYPASEVNDIPAEMRRRWLQQDGTTSSGIVRAAPELTSLISFRELNLIERWPVKGPFQIIFCRNVVIYFNEQTKSEVWRRLVELMSGGGFIYSGHSERISGPAAAHLNMQGVTIYQKQGGI